jgi:hypothetical protein
MKLLDIEQLAQFLSLPAFAKNDQHRIVTYDAYVAMQSICWVQVSGLYPNAYQ